MNPFEAARTVFAAAPGETLHWTVVWDRALQQRLIDPMADPGARDAFLKALNQMARHGEIERVAPGTYRTAGG